MVSELIRFIFHILQCSSLNEEYATCSTSTSHFHKSRATTDARVLVFAGHDASRALGKTSTKAEDVSPDWSGLDEKEKGVLADWYTFFSKRYNIVGVVEGATNM